MKDQHYMRQALDLAARGYGWVNPNPLVGAVIIKNGAVIGSGWHERYGSRHAEAVAIQSCTADTAGSTLYVNLEPCCHQGKNPPCTEAIIKAGISRVVVGALDPNPLVAGQGLKILREHGIEVTENVLAEECRQINEIFFHYITSKTPYVIMKYAMTMDGKIAAYTGKSQWITGEKARKRVHEQRHRCMAIMVGVGTVLADNPLLTCRLEQGKNPIRIICDTNLRTPLNSRLLQTAADIPTIIATGTPDEGRHLPYRQAGCDIITLPLAKQHINLAALMKELGRRGIDSLLLEGGPTLNWSALQAGLVHRLQAYIAPKLLGGATAPTPLAGEGHEHPDKAFRLINSSIAILDEDILVEGEVFYSDYGSD